MRHSLAQLLAATSSREGSPRPPATACSFPSEEETTTTTPSSSSSSSRGERESSGEAGNEAQPRHEEDEEEEEEAMAATAGFLEEPDDGDDGSAELLFPAGLELDDWLEAAVVAAAETRPDWDVGGGEGSLLSPFRKAASEGAMPSRRPGSNRLKAAAAARLNRQKKKQYVLGLESRLQGLAAENRQLRDRNRGLGRRLRHLERETGYLRAVLANQSALGRLLSRLAGGGGGARRVGWRISTSLFEDPPRAPQRTPSTPPSAAAETRWPSWEKSSNSSSSSSSSSDHDYALPAPEEEEEEEEEEEKRGILSSPGGICLHVDRDQVSVEFCSVCARRAASSSWAALPAAAAAAASPPSSFAAKIFSFRCLPCQAPLCRG